MARNDKNPIIINGLDLVQKSPYVRKFTPFEKYYERDFPTAQELVLTKLENVIQQLTSSHEQLHTLDEIFLEFAIPSDFIAKSYRIESIFRDSKLERVGSYAYTDKNEKEGKIEVVRGTNQEIQSFKQLVTTPNAKIQNDEIRRIDDLNLAEPLIILDDSKTNDYFELLFYSVSSSQKDELLENIRKKLVVDPSKLVYKWDKNNVLILNTKFDNINIDSLENFNYLRSAFNYGFGFRDATKKIVNSNLSIINDEPLENDTNDLPYVGMIDGGVATDLKPFETVEQIYEVDGRPNNFYVDHGSSVASLLLYGDFSKELNDGEETVLRPSCNVISIRGLPSDKDIEFNLINLENVIKEAVPKYPQVKIWNLSIGPNGPISEYFVSSLTRLLDELSYEHDIIFVIAVGNTGNELGISRKIQIPADSVNNFAVTAFYYDASDNKIVAPYSSIGPGRIDAMLKPDIIDHGGFETIDPVITFSNEFFQLNQTFGTSFSAPLVARKLAIFNHTYPMFSATETRALVINNLALNYQEGSIVDEGLGYLEDVNNLVYSNNENEIKIMYSGQLSAKSYVEVPIPLPDNYDSKQVEFTWTIVTKTPVNPENPNEYTKYFIEDDFIPHMTKYRLRHPDTKKTKTLDLSDERDVDIAEILKEEGYKKPDYPMKDSDKYIFLDESDLKKEKMKWNTVKTQKLTKYASSLKEPILRLHGLSRDDTRDRIEYCLVVNVRLKDDINIIEDIQSKFENLYTIENLIDIDVDSQVEL